MKEGIEQYLSSKGVVQVRYNLALPCHAMLFLVRAVAGYLPFVSLTLVSVTLRKAFISLLHLQHLRYVP